MNVNKTVHVLKQGCQYAFFICLNSVMDSQNRIIILWKRCVKHITFKAKLIRFLIEKIVT